MIRFSFGNLIAPDAVTITLGAEDSEYPATFLKEVHRPFKPSKSTAATSGAERWIVDFGSATSIGLVALIRPNFASASIQGSDDGSTWTAYNQAVTVTRMPWVKSRYAHVHDIVGTFSHRYLGIYAPAQTPVAEGRAAVRASTFFLGGLWAGSAWVEPPFDLDLGEQLPTHTPLIDNQPSHGGWRERIYLGEPIWSIKGAIRRAQTADTPALSDMVATWLTIEQSMAESGWFLLQKDHRDPSQVAVMRMLDDPTWTIGLGQSRGSIDFEEVVGP